MASNNKFTNKTVYEVEEFINNYYKNNKRPSQPGGYIASIRNRVLLPISCEILIDDIANIIQDTKYQERLTPGLERVSTFLTDIVVLKSLGNKTAQGYLKDVPNNSINSYKGVLENYIDFLKRKCPTIKTKYTKYTITDWNNAIDKLDKIISVCNASNGIGSLLNNFPSHDAFIKEVIENSYFFTAEDAQKRFDELIKEIHDAQKGGIPVPTRKSTKAKVQHHGKFWFKDENNGNLCNIPISLDANGNQNVVTLIKNKTGYTVSNGKDSIFQNFIISHIWGEAFDPRNFTSLWNLAIVPAWGNFLLDKTDSLDDLTLKMINTFKAIAIKHYKMKNLDWQSVGKKNQNMKCDEKYVVHGTYHIKEIQNKNMNGQNRSLGPIKPRTITI